MRKGIDVEYFVSERIIEAVIKDRSATNRKKGKKVDIHYHSKDTKECNGLCISEERYQRDLLDK